LEQVLVDPDRDRRDTKTENCTFPQVIMPFDEARQGVARTPAAPRSLKTVKGARMELCRLYHEVKLGEVDPFVARTLVTILSVLLNSARTHDLNERLDELETRLTQIQPNSYARANGWTVHR
jgi:hypothetical protein